MKTFLLPILSAIIVADACLLPWEMDGSGPPPALERRHGPEPIWGSANTIPIGQGNRWSNNVVPRGVGSQPGNTVISTLMNPVELRAAVNKLASEYHFDVLEAPEKSHEGTKMWVGKVGPKHCDKAYKYFFTTGIHPRERSGPDALVYFMADLLYAKKTNTGLTFGGRGFTKEQVQRAAKAGILFMPLVNPDGTAYDQAESNCWRRNRNPNGPVDINRNFDFVWDYKTKFEPNVGPWVASDNPADNTFQGTAPFSEPETRNVKWVMDKHPKVEWTLDLHSNAGMVLFSWGDDFNQAHTPSMNFQNPAYDGMRGLRLDMDGARYSSYMDLDTWRNDAFVAVRTVDGMNGAVDSNLRLAAAAQAVSVYPAAGCVSDYMSARGLVNSTLGRVHGLTLEYGIPSLGDCDFYPDLETFNDDLRQIGGGLMEFLLAAADVGLGNIHCSRDDSDSDSDSDSDED